MRNFRPWLALAVLAVFALACSDGVVDPSTSGSSALALSATPTVRADYSLNLHNTVGNPYRSQNDRVKATKAGGVNASGPWRSRLKFTTGDLEDSAGNVQCLKLIDDGGVRLGGVVTYSTNPALIGATMVASMHDGSPDRSTGIRIFIAGSDIDAQKHCTDGYSFETLGINGVVTFQAVTGFITVASH